MVGSLLPFYASHLRMLCYFYDKVWTEDSSNTVVKIGSCFLSYLLDPDAVFSVVAPFLAVQFKVSSLNLWNGLFTFLICLFGGYIFYKVDLFMRVRGKR